MNKSNNLHHHNDHHNDNNNSDGQRRQRPSDLGSDATARRRAGRPNNRDGRLTGYTVGAAVLGLLLPVAACSREGDANQPAVPDVAALSSSSQVDCDFENLDQLTVQPTCYEISVPEDWSDPDDDDRVVLHAARFAATDQNAKAAQPLIYLDGGPGAPTLESLYAYEPMVEAFGATRDVVFFDQRGTGTATPSLDCDAEFDQLLSAYAPGASDGDASTTYLNAMSACRDRLEAAGVNLRAYNSVASSHDIEAIRVALGYEQLDVWGISYGTRLAQSYMRLYPDSARAVIIDSVLPTDARLDVDLPANAKQSIERLFAACQADAVCNDAYPAFESDFYSLYDQLNAEPTTIEVTIEDGTRPVVFTGDDLMHLAFVLMYNKTMFESLPRAITAARQGDFTEISTLSSSTLGADLGMAEGMHVSVICSEEVAFESREDRDAAAAADPRFAHVGSVEDDTIFDVCAMWDAGRAPASEFEPVTSDIPTLVVTGFFDPVTPPQYAEQVAKGLDTSYVVEFPTEGHGPSLSGCGFEIVSAFLADPSVAPDSSCVNGGTAPTWVVEPTVLELVPGEVAGIGSDGATTVTGVLPKGWEEFQPGAFLRGDSTTDETALLIQAPGDRTVDETLADYLNEPLAVGEPIDVAGAMWETRSGEAEGTPVRVLVSPTNEFIVMIAASSDEIDELTETVAVPVAASLKMG